MRVCVCAWHVWKQRVRSQLQFSALNFLKNLPLVSFWFAPIPPEPTTSPPPQPKPHAIACVQEMLELAGIEPIPYQEPDVNGPAAPSLRSAAFETTNTFMLGFAVSSL